MHEKYCHIRSGPCLLGARNLEKADMWTLNRQGIMGSRLESWSGQEKKELQRMELPRQWKPWTLSWIVSRLGKGNYSHGQFCHQEQFKCVVWMTKVDWVLALIYSQTSKTQSGVTISNLVFKCERYTFGKTWLPHHSLYIRTYVIRVIVIYIGLWIF